MAVSIRKILLIDDFLYSWNEIKREKWRYLFLFFQFVVFGGIFRYSTDDNFMLFNCLLCALLAIQHGLEWRKLIIVIVIYALMSMFPIIIYGLEGVMFRQYVGYAIRILTGCFIISYYKHDFISKFENLVFVLAYVSIPLFILQVLNPDIYSFLTPITQFITGGNNEFIRNGEHLSFQYIGVYHQHGLVNFRNSGFMWEPGAYAMMLTWASLFLMYKTKFQWHRRMIIYIIAILTTFSLLGYACAIVLALMFLMQRDNWKAGVYLMIAGGITLLLLFQTPLFVMQRNMMTNKMEYYANNSEAQLEGATPKYINNEETKAVGRLSQFYIMKDILSDTPLGRGMANWRYRSSNGFIELIIRWGISAILILLVSFYFFTKRLALMAQLQPKWYITLMTMAVLIMPAISNPLYNRVFFLTLILFPLFAKRQVVY